MKRTILGKSIFKRWINQFFDKELLMLTISEPHQKLSKLTSEKSNLEVIISEIINIVNRYVFGKNKRFEYIRGIIVEENIHGRPHYHILLLKPEEMDFERFKNKLEKVERLLCNENSQLNLNKYSLTTSIRNLLSQPCYDSFAKVSKFHNKLASYLSKTVSNYYILQGRAFNRTNDNLNLYVDFYQ